MFRFIEMDEIVRIYHNDKEVSSMFVGENSIELIGSNSFRLGNSKKSYEEIDGIIFETIEYHNGKSYTSIIGMFNDKAGYGRRINIEVNLREYACDICGSDGDNIGFDSSDGEYGSVIICKSCLKKLSNLK